jgi:hypothetical protein
MAGRERYHIIIWREDAGRSWASFFIFHFPTMATTTSAALSPSSSAAAAPSSPVTTSNSNARHTIERLLTTETCSGKYSTGSKLPATGSGSIPIPCVAIVPRDNDDGDTVKERKSLTFPLNDADVQTIKDHAERAGVGLIDRTVVNLDVRKT